MYILNNLKNETILVFNQKHIDSPEQYCILYKKMNK